MQLQHDRSWDMLNQSGLQYMIAIWTKQTSHKVTRVKPQRMLSQCCSCYAFVSVFEIKEKELQVHNSHMSWYMSCPSWHRTGSSWSPVRTLPVAPLWCDLGFVPNSSGNKAAANLRPPPWELKWFSPSIWPSIWPNFFHSNFITSFASEPQCCVWDFCCSLLELSELRKALVFSSLASQCWILTGSGIQNYKNSLHNAGMLTHFWSFFGILPLDPLFFFHHLVLLVYPCIWQIKNCSASLWKPR